MTVLWHCVETPGYTTKKIHRLTGMAGCTKSLPALPTKYCKASPNLVLRCTSGIQVSSRFFPPCPSFSTSSNRTKWLYTSSILVCLIEIQKYCIACFRGTRGAHSVSKRGPVGMHNTAQCCGFSLSLKMSIFWRRGGQYRRCINF